MKSEVPKKRAKMRAADQPPPSLGQSLRFNLASLIFLVAGMGLAALLLQGIPGLRRAAATPAPALSGKGAPAAMTASGPWGELEYTRFALQEPDDYLPSEREQLPAARWVFENYAPDQLAALFSSLETSPGIKTQLLDRSRWQLLADGVVLQPSRELLQNLGRPARQRLYPVLGESRFNFSHYYPFRFRGGGFNEWFVNSSLPSEVLDIVRELTYTNRTGALCLADIGVLQGRLTPVEFRLLLQSLYSEPSVLLSLRVREGSDVNALAAYWGRGGREQTVLPILKSLARAPGGGSLSVTHLLPPFARMRLYTYHSDTNNPVNGQDCFWSAVNFFRREPDPRLAAGASPHEILVSDYEECRERPRLGDVLLLMENKKAIHACVYVADDVVFTKNGANFHQPWVLMQINDMMARYSSDQTMSVVVLRHRNPGL